MTRFYLDENVTMMLASLLRMLGYDTVATAELQRKGATDVSQLSFAADTRRIIIPHNRWHFEMLREAWQPWARAWGVAAHTRHAGILVIPDGGILAPAEATHAISMLIADAETVENELRLLTRSGNWRIIHELESKRRTPCPVSPRI